MARLVYLCLLIVCGAFISPWTTSQSVDPKVTLEINQQLVLPGTPVRLWCRLTGFPDPPKLVNFLKGAYLAMVGAPITEEITVHQDILSTLYKKIPRYQAARHTEGADIIYTLNINETHHNDSGFFACSAEHEEFGQMHAVRQLNVYSPPSHMNINTNGTLSLEDGELVAVNFSVSQVVPIPVTSVWLLEDLREVVNPLDSEIEIKATAEQLNRIRDGTMEKWRDFSHLFHVGQHSVPRCTENPSIKDCPLYRDYEVVVNQSSLRASPLLDGKILTCVSHMNDYNKDIVSASVLLDISFNPVILCDGVLAGLLRVKLNTTLTISCKVYSNPILPDSGLSADPENNPPSRVFLDGLCSGGTIITDGDIYTVMEEAISSNKKNRTLKLVFKQKITKSYIGKSYCLRVSNNRGTSEQPITLREQVVSLGAQKLIMSSAIVYIVAFLLAGVICYNSKV